MSDSAATLRRKRGYLPHSDEAGATHHVVFRLADSMPRGAFERLGAVAPNARLGEAERWLDRGLGSRLLERDDVASLVAASLVRFDGQRYRLHAWCVMPTHVHALVAPEPDRSLASILHSWKSYTAHGANRLLGRQGAFWAEDYFDRAMRDDRHREATIDYVEANPVTAGLRLRRGDWRWSSAVSRIG
ncbi:MAG TPA: transposase [Caulobacteraceae bacterium]|jgi:REP element-mobilizing transposase RayT|nr:transposase [Caulobacteraceae bacterium]